MELIVKGHSGFSIDIVREGTNLYVYKRCSDADKAERLMRQAAKQEQATGFHYSGFQTPHIIATEHNENGASIKMDYIYSRNFMEYFESAGFEQIDYFIHTLIRFIEEELAHSPVQVIPADIVNSKLLSVKKTIAANTRIRKDETLASIMEKSERLLTCISEWRLPVGICHGDLTFSNILFTANTYYLIDFLDSFIESPLLDIVKLRQDSAHVWSAKLYTKPYDPIRLGIISRKIDTELDSYFQQYNWYNAYYLPLQVLNLLRVLQYATEDAIVDDLETELTKLLYAV